MSGLATFVQDIAYGMSYVLPALLHCTATGIGIWAVWTYWEASRAGRGGEVWLKSVSGLLVAGTLLSYKTMLAAGSRSLGFTMSEPQNTGMPADADALLGNGPADLLVNSLAPFDLYFQLLGAFIVFAAIMAFLHHTSGRSRSSISYCVVKALAGLVLVNSDQVIPLLAHELMG